MKLSKKIISLVAAAAVLMCMLPVFSAAATTYNAADYTNVQEIIPKLNKVLNGGAELFIDRVYENPDHTGEDLRVGGYINSDIRYSWGPESRPHYGWTCFAYAQSVYYYLFGDVLYRCEGTDGYGVEYTASEVVLNDVKPLSFDVLYNAGVGTGAFVEAPNHYYLILTYDRETITTLGGNEDGYGRGEIKISNYTWDEFNGKRHRVPAYSIVQPTITKNTICDHKYDKDSFACSCGHIDEGAIDYVWHSVYEVTSSKASSYSLPFSHGKKTSSFAKHDAVRATGVIENEKGETCYRLVDGSFINGNLLEPLYVDYPGDVTGDNDVTAADARIVLRASVGLESTKKYSDTFRRADVNYDNNITAADARLILRASVGLEYLD